MASNERLPSWFAIVFVLILLGWFHNRSWYAPDEGYYAHTAERIIDGEVLNRDVHDIHGGSINFANAAAMWLFGKSMLAMRYPLVLMGLVQAFFVQALFVRRGWWSVLAVVAMASLSTIQFLNPTAHWYCLFLFTILAWVIHNAPRRLVVVGFLLGCIFWFRQLTGVFAAMSAFTWVFLQSSTTPARATAGQLIAQRAICLLMLGGLVSYLALCVRPDGAIAYGSGPVLLIWIAAIQGRSRNAEVMKCVMRLAAGFGIASLPLLTYHAMHGSYAQWLDETVFRSGSLTTLDFIRDAQFYRLVRLGVEAATSGRELLPRLNGAFWVVLPLLPIVLSVLTIRAVLSGQRLESIAVLASFYSLVSVHYQIPNYLWFSIGPVTIALMTFVRPRASRARFGLGGLLTVICIVAILCQAGKSARSLPVIVRGGGSEQVDGSILDTRLRQRCGLKIPLTDAAKVVSTLNVIRQHTSKNDAVLFLPANPEYYFLSARRNPLPYSNVAVGMSNEKEFEASLNSLDAVPPVLVFINERDKYMSRLVQKLWEAIRSDYVELPEATIVEHRVFVLRSRASQEIVGSQSQAAAVCCSELLPRCPDAVVPLCLSNE